MSDFPKAIDFPNTVITPATYESIGADLAGSSTNLTASNTAWPTANTAVFVPFRISTPIIIVKIFWQNGSTVAVNNVDVGIYDSQGNRLVSSGSMATSGASALQAIDITDTTLEQGLYYMAMARDGTSDTMNAAIPAVPIPRALGIYSVATSFTLPATVTFAGSISAFVPFMGLARNTTI